jgi:hypothetical protein
MAPDPFLVPEGSDFATCPEAQSTSPVRRGLQYHHVPYETERATHHERALMSPRTPSTVRATRQERASVLPHAPRHQARHPAGEGSGVTTFLVAPGPPPAQEGSSVAT